MLIVMDKSTHEEHLAQHLQTNNKQYKITVTFLIGYNGIFNLTNRNNDFRFILSINDDDFNQITISPGAYETDSLNNAIKRIVIKKGCFSENYPSVIKPIFLTLGSIIEIKPNFVGGQISFVHDDSLRNLLGFNPEIPYEKYLSPHPVDIRSFVNVFLETYRSRNDFRK